MIPDVILHFPDKRDMVIDSKISFKAFEDYQNADGEKRTRRGFETPYSLGSQPCKGTKIEGLQQISHKKVRHGWIS